MATIFCSDHLRQLGSSLTKWLRKDGNAAEMGEKAAAHGLMLLSFALGVLIAAILSGVTGIRTIWLALIPLGIVFGNLLRADLTKEKQLLEMTPRGH